MTRSGEFLRTVDELNAANGEKAKGLSEELDEVARTATEDLREPIAGMRQPLDKLVSAVENGTDYHQKLDDFAAEGQKVIDICRGETSAMTPSAAPTEAPVLAEAPPASEAPEAGITYTLACTTADGSLERITDYRAAWSQAFETCMPIEVGGTPSLEEVQANDGYTDDPRGARFLYTVCAATAGHYVDGPLSENQAAEVVRALMLCPDHPKRAQLEANTK
ncbi:hypothetical protein [Arthrobacter sp. ZGTC131]|uniref:hypothetical protein n=1 Tax=Arthrobacter sp. ZGTC131 TaxID=2058898 RepID=UPI000CE377E6|nr:hypothetical protein [Arthrobacter sp. ZGTC131]